MNLEAYKKRLSKTLPSSAIKEDTKKLVKLQFKDSPAYTKAVLIDDNLEETYIDIRIANIDKSVYNKRFYLMPDQVAKEGWYIKLEDNDEEHYWLIEEYEKGGVSHYAKVTYCNQRINFINGQFLPCVASGESYGVKMTATNSILLETDTKVKLTVGRNILSELLQPDFRVIFGHSKQGIYKSGDTTHYKKGLITMTCRKDKYIDGLDDLVNNLAYQPLYDYSEDNNKYEIKGEENIFINKSYTYILEPKIQCTFKIDNENVVVEKVGINEITISCNKPNELINIKALVNGRTIEEKNILTII